MERHGGDKNMGTPRQKNTTLSCSVELPQGFRPNDGLGWLADFSPWRALVAAHLWAMQAAEGSLADQSQPRRQRLAEYPPSVNFVQFHDILDHPHPRRRRFGHPQPLDDLRS